MVAVKRLNHNSFTSYGVPQIGNGKRASRLLADLWDASIHHLSGSRHPVEVNRDVVLDDGATSPSSATRCFRLAQRRVSHDVRALTALVYGSERRRQEA